MPLKGTCLSMYFEDPSGVPARYEQANMLSHQPPPYRHTTFSNQHLFSTSNQEFSPFLLRKEKRKLNWQTQSIMPKRRNEEEPQCAEANCRNRNRTLWRSGTRVHSHLNKLKEKARSTQKVVNHFNRRKNKAEEGR